MSIDRALERVTEFWDEPLVRIYRAWFKQIQEMPGADSVLGRIAVAADSETLLDYLAEIRYALLFARLEFQVEFEPLGKQGPDLRVSRGGNSAFAEVTRFRPIHPGPPELDLADEATLLPEYGNVERDIKKAIRKIYRKFSQVGMGDSIIAIWNDDEDMEEIEVEAAVRDLRGDPSLPAELLFVVYGSKWISKKQFHCFSVHHRARSHQALWQEQISTYTVSDIVQNALKEEAG